MRAKARSVPEPALGGIASPSGSCRIVPEAESLIRSRGENTPLASSTSFRRASTRALPGGQPRRFIMLTRRVGCRIHEGKWCAQRNRCLEAKGVRGLNAQWPSELRWRLRVKSRHICRFDNNDGFKAHHLALWIRQLPGALAPSGPGHPVGFLLFLERFSSNYSH
jgi:hypothetical protein